METEIFTVKEYPKFKPKIGDNVLVSYDGGKTFPETADYLENRHCMLAGSAGGSGYFGEGFGSDGSTGCDKGLILSDVTHFLEPIAPANRERAIEIIETEFREYGIVKDDSKAFSSHITDKLIKEGLLLDKSGNEEMLTDEMIKEWVKKHGYYGSCTQEYHEGLEEGAKYGRGFSNAENAKSLSSSIVYPSEDLMNESFEIVSMGYHPHLVETEIRDMIYELHQLWLNSSRESEPKKENKL